MQLYYMMIAITHQSTTIKLCVPKLYYYQVGHNVVPEYVHLRTDGSLKGELHLKVIDADGKISYVHAFSPNIILPQDILVGFTTSDK